MCDCEAVSRYCTHKPETARDFLFPVASKIDAAGIVQDVVQEARLVDEFRFAINDLSDVIDQLQVRVLPVSRTEYAIPVDAMDHPPMSEARNELFRLHTLTGALRGIIDRLEV